MRLAQSRTPPRRPLTITTALLLILSASAVSAQDKGQQRAAGQPFEVRLNVAVFDAAGRPVEGLRAEDFRLTEDGAAQQVRQLTHHDGPTVFGLVVDNSGSLRSDIDKVVRFAKLVVEGSDPRSAIFVERFVDSDHIVVMQDFTTNRRALERALDEMYIEGGESAITDALYLAAEHVAGFTVGGQTTRRRALVLVTDGEDRANAHSVEQLVAKLRETGVQVHVLGLAKIVKLNVQSPGEAIAYLNRVAVESGGALYLPDKKANLAEFAEELNAELNAPYTIAYTPTNQKRGGAPRKLDLTVADAPDGTPRRVVFRNTYTAAKK